MCAFVVLSVHDVVRVLVHAAVRADLCGRNVILASDPGTVTNMRLKTGIFQCFVCYIKYFMKNSILLETFCKKNNKTTY